MINGVSQDKYFNLFGGGTVSMGPEKNQGAYCFLGQLYERLQSGKAVTLPKDLTLDGIVAKVVSGYQKKQGILHRIWECFLSIIGFFIKSRGIFLSDAQKIQHYASEITKTDSSSLLKADDPAIKLKEALIGKIPQNRRQEIVKANAKQCIQLALDEGGSDRDILLKTAACALEINDANSAKRALSSLHEQRGDLPSESISIFSSAIAACVLQNDEDGAKELIKSTEEHFFMFDNYVKPELDKLAEKCFKDGKISTLVLALEKANAEKNFIQQRQRVY